MAFKVKRGHPKQIPVEYFEQKEIEVLKHKYPHRTFLPFSEVVKLGTRRTLGIEERIHRAGGIVTYKGNLAKIREVTKKGLWIEPFSKSTDKSISSPNGKVIFVTEKNVEKKVHPLATNVPIYFSPAFQMK